VSAALSPEERQRLETLFDRAADLPHAEHAGFVARECGSNGALRDQLSRMLAGLSGQDVLGALQPAPAPRTGTRIGPYKLLEKIGEGGMGDVYAAEQREPVVRRVALKVIKLGMDSAQVVARFEAERQALARMAHPNVAQVFDGGSTDDGRPYFVMELVAGEPITEYCDRRKLSTRARLELVLAVCEGVQHAHQKGLIHRDLKPSNLLVMPQDGRAVPKIIDFGIARATTGRLAERTLHTMAGQIVGTLDYMSPEQADPTGVGVDTRSDVYSLGVVLYQLLSGLLPFDHAMSGDTPLSEVQRTIREEDPPTPSTRLRRQARTVTSIAPLHGTDGRSLIRQLAGDLDWICLKALEKDPARRYPSVSELAADVRRHLADEPVLAGRPGALYRARKFVRRHRVGVVAGILVAAGVAAGLFGTVAGRLEAQASARVAAALRPQAHAHRLRQLEQEADRLWPAHPERIPELAAWVDRARALLDDCADEGYEATLAEMRAGALPWTAEERERDRATHPRAEELASMQGEVARLLAKLERGEIRGAWVLEAEERVRRLKPQIAALEPELDERRTWSFANEDVASSHDLLGGLVEGLEELAAQLEGTAPTRPEHGWSVPRRLAEAQRLRTGFLPGGELARRWGEALVQIHEAHPELVDLGPQAGLVPIGRDPESYLWEFWHVQSGTEPARDDDGKLVLEEASGLVFVLLPGGVFLMGAQWTDPTGANYDSDAQQGNREGPPVEVEVPAFFMSKFEMTQAQWMAATGTNPSVYQLGIVKQHPRNPVNQVNWDECVTTMLRLGLTLPDEEQWEYAARAGTTTARPWEGDDPLTLRQHANFLGRRQGTRDEFQPVTTVGSFPPNAFGLHDVIGNVREWCANPPYELGTPGGAPETLRMRMTRGGGSRDPEEGARSAFRAPFRKSMDDTSLGLRPARAIE